MWANPPAPLTLCTNHCAQEIAESVIKALAPACPDRALAGWGRRFRIAIQGTDPRNGRPFIWHMFHARPGGGASPAGDGWPTAGEGQAAGGIKFGSVEVTEVRFPLFFETHEFRPDSGGTGSTGAAPARAWSCGWRSTEPARANTAGRRDAPPAIRDPRGQGRPAAPLPSSVARVAPTGCSGPRRSASRSAPGMSSCRVGGRRRLRRSPPAHAGRPGLRPRERLPDPRQRSPGRFAVRPPRPPVVRPRSVRPPRSASRVRPRVRPPRPSGRPGRPAARPSGDATRRARPAAPGGHPKAGGADVYRIGIDVGGTFTDLVAVDEAGRVTLAKAASTPRTLDRRHGGARPSWPRPWARTCRPSSARPSGSSTAPPSPPTPSSSARARGSGSSRPRATAT